MTNANMKRKIRERMAATGENYTTARRALQAERDQARKRERPADDTDPDPEGTS